MNEEIYEEILNELDESDERFILVDFEQEKPELLFRWEYAHESLTEADSVFRINFADS